MQLSKLRIDQLNPAKYNPRKISDEALAGLKASIDTFGYVEPIIVNQRTGNTVVGGHQRLKVLQAGGVQEIEVVLVDMDETREKALNVALNNKHIAGEFDAKMLNEILAELEQSFPEYDALRFDVLADDFKIKTYEEKDAIPEPKKESPFSVGDLIELGRHRLLCGDATDIEAVEHLVGGEPADMVFTDPPYLMDFHGAIDGAGNSRNRHGAILNDKMSKADGENFLRGIATSIRMFCKGAWYVCFYRLGIDNMMGALGWAGLKWRNLIIWDKGKLNLSNSDYKAMYEPIVYGWCGDYEPILYGWNNEHNFYGRKGETDIWDEAVPSLWSVERTKNNDLHPTMKPVALCERAICNSSRKGQRVLDLFGGAGSTMIACESVGRDCLMMELDPIYCRVIVDRWVEFTGENKITINGKKVSWSIES